MINFDNDTQNFEPTAEKSLSPLKFFVTKVTINNNSKRLNIPHAVRNRYMQHDYIRFLWNPETEHFFVDFRPNEDDIIPEEIDTKDARIITTGRGYFVTLPSKWFKFLQPTKASLTQLEEKKTAYKVQFYGIDEQTRL